MNTRARFRCIEVVRKLTTGAWGPEKMADSVVLTFNAVMGPENTEWSKYTPSGNLTINITNPALFDQFVVGRDYYIDISPTQNVLGEKI